MADIKTETFRTLLELGFDFIEVYWWNGLEEGPKVNCVAIVYNQWLPGSSARRVRAPTVTVVGGRARLQVNLGRSLSSPEQRALKVLIQSSKRLDPRPPIPTPPQCPYHVSWYFKSGAQAETSCSSRGCSTPRGPDPQTLQQDIRRKGRSTPFIHPFDANCAVGLPRAERNSAACGSVQRSYQASY